MIPFIIVLSSLISLAILIFLLYIFIFVRPRAKSPENKALLCDYAHRGLHGNGTPENSLAAFEKACAEGFGIELDVQLSRDGTVMVFHDATLIRMTGVEKKLCELDSEELQSLSLAGTDQKIPTFSEVLKLVNGRVPLLVELKGENTDSSLCPKVAELLKEYKGDYCVESFNPLLIRNMRKLMPEVYYGQLYTNVCKEKKKNSILNILLTCMVFNFLAHPDFIAYSYHYRNSLPVKLTTKFYKAERFVWTVRDDSEMEKAKSNGECAIFERQ